SRLTRDRANLHDAFGDLGHLALEELEQEVGVRPRERHLRALRRLLDREHERADVVPLAIVIAADLLAYRKDRLGAIELHDHVAAIDLLHGAPHQLTEAFLILLIHTVALELAHALVHDL